MYTDPKSSAAAKTIDTLNRGKGDSATIRHGSLSEDGSWGPGKSQRDAYLAAKGFIDGSMAYDPTGKAFEEEAEKRDPTHHNENPILEAMIKSLHHIRDDAANETPFYETPVIVRAPNGEIDYIDHRGTCVNPSSTHGQNLIAQAADTSSTAAPVSTILGIPKAERTASNMAEAYRMRSFADVANGDFFIGHHKPSAPFDLTLTPTARAARSFAAELDVKNGLDGGTSIAGDAFSNAAPKRAPKLQLIQTPVGLTGPGIAPDPTMELTPFMHTFAAPVPRFGT
jgi:hypothetical protein